MTFPSTVLPRHSRTRDCLNQTNLLGISSGYLSISFYNKINIISIGYLLTPSCASELEQRASGAGQRLRGKRGPGWCWGAPGAEEAAQHVPRQELPGVQQRVAGRAPAVPSAGGRRGPGVVSGARAAGAGGCCSGGTRRRCPVPRLDAAPSGGSCWGGLAWQAPRSSPPSAEACVQPGCHWLCFALAVLVLPSLLLGTAGASPLAAAVAVSAALPGQPVEPQEHEQGVGGGPEPPVLAGPEEQAFRSEAAAPGCSAPPPPSAGSSPAAPAPRAAAGALAWPRLAGPRLSARTARCSAGSGRG